MKWISAYFLKCYIKSDRLLQGNCEQSLWNQEVDKYVDALPSLDIVTCGECKHRSICCRGNIPLNDNGYCSDGERNTDSNTFNTLDALKKKKADFRQVWLDDEYNEIGRSNSEGADDEV